MRGEFRSNCFLSAHGPPASVRVPEMCGPLSRRLSAEVVLLLGPVSGDGLRPADLPREPARHRGLPAFHERQTVPHGIPRQGCALHAGRRQRVPRLAHLCRLRPGADRHRAAAVCPRSDRRRSGPEPVRAWTPPPSTCACRCFRGRSSASTRPPSKCTRCSTCTATSPRLSALPTARCTTSTSSTRSCRRPGAFYVMDRGYIDFERLYVFTLCAAFFVVRTKENVLLQRRYSHPVDKTTGVAIRSDRHPDRHRLGQGVSGSAAARQLLRCRNQTSA